MTQDKKDNAENVIDPEKMTVAQKIWEDMKNKPIDMFGLPFQIVSQYCSPVFIEPEKLYLKFKVGAVLPTLEQTFINKYEFDLMDKYITVVHKKIENKNAI